MVEDLKVGVKYVFADRGKRLNEVLGEHIEWFLLNPNGRLTYCCVSGNEHQTDYQLNKRALKNAIESGDYRPEMAVVVTDDEFEAMIKS